MIAPPPGKTCRRGHTDLAPRRRPERPAHQGPYWRCRTCTRDADRLRKALQPKKPRARRVIGQSSGFRTDWVDLAPIRAAVLEAMGHDASLTFMEIAARVGWLDCRSGKGDTSRLKRALGLSSYQISHGHRKGQPHISYGISERRALLIAEAIHLDPWEVGL